MNNRALVFIGLAVLISCLAGCTPVAPTPPEIPPAVISHAAFIPGEVDTVLIDGEFFKIQSDDKKDVVVSLNGRNWFPAKSITKSSPTSYTAVLPYGIAFPQVWVRVYGMNDDYSGTYLVEGLRR
jgi:hypothetical protein